MFFTCIIQVIKLEVDGNIIDLPHIEGIIILNIMRLVSKSKDKFEKYKKIFKFKGTFYGTDAFKGQRNKSVHFIRALRVKKIEVC
jgi:hypothetical protein